MTHQGTQTNSAPRAIRFTPDSGEIEDLMAVLLASQTPIRWRGRFCLLFHVPGQILAGGWLLGLERIEKFRGVATADLAILARIPEDGGPADLFIPREELSIPQAREVVI